jgi:uncharacterized protein (DUF983 family)
MLKFAVLFVCFIAVFGEEWKDSAVLSRLWQNIASKNTKDLIDTLATAPGCHQHRASGQPHSHPSASSGSRIICIHIICFLFYLSFVLSLFFLFLKSKRIVIFPL